MSFCFRKERERERAESFLPWWWYESTNKSWPIKEGRPRRLDSETETSRDGEVEGEGEETGTESKMERGTTRIRLNPSGWIRWQRGGGAGQGLG